MKKSEGALIRDKRGSKTGGARETQRRKAGLAPDDDKRCFWTRGQTGRWKGKTAWKRTEQSDQKQGGGSQQGIQSDDQGGGWGPDENHLWKNNPKIIGQGKGGNKALSKLGAYNQRGNRKQVNFFETGGGKKAT